MQIMTQEISSDSFVREADSIRATLDSDAHFPLGRENLYAQMLGSAEAALRSASRCLAMHKECLPREAVEILTESKLPCGHPNACGTSDAAGARIRCAWCDEVNALTRGLRIARCTHPTCEDGMIDSGGFDQADRPISIPCPECNP